MPSEALAIDANILVRAALGAGCKTAAVTFARRTLAAICDTLRRRLTGGANDTKSERTNSGQAGNMPDRVRTPGGQCRTGRNSKGRGRQVS